MQRVLRLLLVAASMACLVTAPLAAATLQAIQGEVMVNRGNGYRFVSSTAELSPGDMIMANAGGTAWLTYEDGCKVVIEAGTVATVGEKSPCATPGAFGHPHYTLALGAVVIGLGVGAAILLGSGSDQAASP